LLSSSARPASDSGIDRDRPDYTVYFGGWDLGSRALFYDARLDLKAMG
jgi:hypothetical protein